MTMVAEKASEDTMSAGKDKAHTAGHNTITKPGEKGSAVSDKPVARPAAAAVMPTASTSAAATATASGGDKPAEKRRALGRGLESLLSGGPRAVAAAPAPAAVPNPAGATPIKDGALAPTPGPPTGASGAATAGVTAHSGVPGSTDGDPVPDTVAQIHAVATRSTAEGDEVIELPLDSIDHNPYQTRMTFEPEAMEELRDSIRVQGVMQPILVRATEAQLGQPPRYVLILGERRLRASKMAGKATIPVVVKRVSEQQAAEMTVVENLQREDLHCLEQAYAFARLSEEFKLTQEQIGKRVGISRETVSNYMRLLRLPFPVMQFLKNNDLSYSHARELLAIDDNETLQKVAEKVVKEKMSVDLLEELIMDMHLGIPGKEAKPGAARWIDPNVRAVQRQIESVIGMKVRIRDRKGKGKITIEYSSLEDFDRVVGLLKRSQK
jgi:ParB family chromosome partitioning protein